MKVSREKLEEENPFVYAVLIRQHDDDLEYAEECLSEGNEETASESLQNVNAIRRFFGDELIELEQLNDAEELKKPEPDAQMHFTAESDNSIPDEAAAAASSCSSTERRYVER